MEAVAPMSPARALSSEASIAASTFSQTASLSSTPPTTVADESDAIDIDASIEIGDSIVASTKPAEPDHQEHQDHQDHVELQDSAPEAPKPQVTAAAAQPPPPSATPSARRSRRSMPTPVYNLVQLVGTAGHGKRRAKGDQVSNRKRRSTMSQMTLSSNQQGEDAIVGASASTSGTPQSDAHQSARDKKPELPKLSKTKEATPTKRIETRSSRQEKPETPAEKPHRISKKRSREEAKKSSADAKIPRELRRLQDTEEFRKINKPGTITTVWANGKYVENPDAGPPRKKAKTTPAAPKVTEPEPEPAPAPVVRRTKKWLDRGLYAGQDIPNDPFNGLTAFEKRELNKLPELAPSGRVNTVLPFPIFNGMRTLIEGRDFKLPFDICHPLPPGQPKPDEWRKITKNRFVGESAAYWKKSPHFGDYQSKCVCTKEDGCGESCQNRIMLYECDDTNCNVGPKFCQNRAFARLQERTKEGGKYRVGVEVIKTDDRGYGIRSNRCFEANQIIMEYTGEIITEEECDRRMNEKYKDNKCYYLMSFDQNMIIDATTGSIARFVNHSCSPNCRMIKWIVSGQPRMALFAGDCPIMTGEELTYDYNFDPFSAKNVQKCLCGSPNCRGVLGPKPKEVKPPKPAKASLVDAVKKGVKAGKRKLKDAFEVPDDTPAKKQRVIKAAKGAAKGAAAVLKQGVSTISAGTKAVLGSKAPTAKSSKAIVKTYSKAKVPVSRLAATRTSPRKPTSRRSDLTIVAAGTGDEDPDETDSN
ncbi:SET domain-containing protein [Hypoxylon sp. FL1284]|nr:SET domain-containing protein [Hypoxylon sp. FL1284]